MRIAGRDRGAGRRARSVPADAADLEHYPSAGHGPGRPGRPHRPPAARGEAAAPDGRRHRQGRAGRAPACRRGRLGGRPPTRAGRAPGRRIPVRGEPLPGAGVHLQARADPRGRVRRACSRSAAGRSTPRSSTRSSESMPTAWTSRSSGSRTRLRGRGLGQGGRATCVRPGVRAMGHSAYRDAGGSFERALIALQPPARES